MTLSRQLKALGACDEAVQWAKDYKTLANAWHACERGDWMLWLCGRMLGKNEWPTRGQLVLACCDCAELSLSNWTFKFPNDNRPKKAIETARLRVAGQVTAQEVITAGTAAHGAANVAISNGGNGADVDAAHVASVAANIAFYSIDTDEAAADEAAGAAYAAMNVTRLECADICRKRLTIPSTLEVYSTTGLR